MGLRKMTTEQQRFADSTTSSQLPDQADSAQHQIHPSQGASEAVRRVLASCADNASYLDHPPSH